jgi:hypothetical protein
MGNGTAAASDYSQVNATAWQSGVTALNPNLIILTLGTNDKTANVTPSVLCNEDRDRHRPYPRSSAERRHRCW